MVVQATWLHERFNWSTFLNYMDLVRVENFRDTEIAEGLEIDCRFCNSEWDKAVKVGSK